jgi:hypothetical protein
MNSLSGSIMRNEKYVQPSFGDIKNNVNFVNGMPVQDFRDRPWISGQMNNLGPTEKVMVGPGLGVGSDVPATGGFQQVYRVLPNNVGAYRLTTLPGRAGPAQNTTGGAAPVWGAVANNRPEKTAYLPARQPPVPGRAQGQGGALTGVTVRESYEKTKRPTNRSETSHRADGLTYAPAKRFIASGTLAQDPTRNKTDYNAEQFQHVDNPTPGIASFVGAYNTTANNIRPADKRSQADRAGAPGRMNVMMNTPGKLTAVRVDCTQANRIPARNGGWTQQYMPLGYQDMNANKGNLNPYATNNSLNMAKNQLAKNQLAVHN